MDINIGFLLVTILKIVAITAWIYGLLWGLGRDAFPAKAITVLAADREEIPVGAVILPNNLMLVWSADGTSSFASDG